MESDSISAPALFLAPGAGLGHIVRTLSIALELEKKGLSALIITTSVWAEALSRITGISVISIAAAKWEVGLQRIIKNLKAEIIIQDTFPFGFRSELPENLTAGVPFVYLARALKTEFYLSALKKKWRFSAPEKVVIIRTEPLKKEHDDLIFQSGARIETLDRRIVFPSKTYKQKIPEQLEDDLINKKVHLVVHSGPVHETEILADMAKKNIRSEGRGKIAVINPFFVKDGRENSHDYFPAAALYPMAYHIYTGGGYNAIAEQAVFKGRVTRIAFERSYDDQAFRISRFSVEDEGERGGAESAAEIILSLCG